MGACDGMSEQRIKFDSSNLASGIKMNTSKFGAEMDTGELNFRYLQIYLRRSNRRRIKLLEYDEYNLK